MKPVFSELLITVSPEKIAIVKFIVEGYDGFASLSTVDNRCGLLVIRFFSSLHEEVLGVLGSLSVPVCVVE